MMYSPIYAALLALLFVGISIRVIVLRRKFKVPVGHGGNEKLHRAMRVQANFAEYVPIALLLLFMLEFEGGSPWLTHGLGSALVIGRISHAIGLRKLDEDYRFRVFGMTLTFLAIIGSVLGLLNIEIGGLLPG